MQQWISHNGKLVPSDTLLFGAQSRAVRYGDGIFETMRFHQNSIPLFTLHWERLCEGMDLMGFEKEPHFTSSSLLQEILQLAGRNKIKGDARIRLLVSRGNGGVYDPENNKAIRIIEAVPLAAHYQTLNINGLVTGLYKMAWKATDSFSNLKSNNYLPYLMGASFAKSQKWNDAFILNQEKRICESTLANVFWIKEGIIGTPPLSEGPVAGVMRRYLIGQLLAAGIPFREALLDEAILAESDAVFLTNAVSGIRWVGRFGDAVYTPEAVIPLYARFIKTIFPD